MKFKYEAIHSPDYSALDTTIYFGDAGLPYLLESAEGLGSPEFTPQTQKAPFQQGETYIDGQHSPRVITLNLRSTSPDFTTTETYKRTISRALNPVGMGYDNNTGETYLGKLSYAPDGVNYTYFIDCVPIGSPVIPFKVFQDKYQPFQVSFFCPDPYWYGAEVSMDLTEYTSSASFQLASIEWVESLNLWVGCGGVSSENLAWSPDGVLWTVSASANTDVFECVRVSPWGTIYACGTGVLYESTDGKTWAATTGFSSASAWRKIAIGERSANDWVFTLISSNGGFATIYADNTGPLASWNYGTIGTSPGLDGGLVWSSALKLMVAVGTNKAYTSSDGIVWNLQTIGTITCIDMEYSPSLNLMVAVGGSACYTSSNGTAWTSRTTSLTNVSRIKWGAGLGKFVIAGQGTVKSAYSTNGTSWSNCAPTTTDMHGAIGYGLSPNIFVGYQSGSKISLDGINWNSFNNGDHYYSFTNAGDVESPFELSCNYIDSTSTASFCVSIDAIWSGVVSPPNRAIKINTTGLLTYSTIYLNTNFGNSSLLANGISEWYRILDGNFFNLKVGLQTFYITKQSLSALYWTLTYRPKYVGV